MPRKQAKYVLKSGKMLHYFCFKAKILNEISLQEKIILYLYSFFFRLINLFSLHNALFCLLPMSANFLKLFFFWCESIVVPGFTLICTAVHVIFSCLVSFSLICLLFLQYLFSSPMQHWMPRHTCRKKRRENERDNCMNCHTQK